MANAPSLTTPQDHIVRPVNARSMSLPETTFGHLFTARNVLIRLVRSLAKKCYHLMEYRNASLVNTRHPMESIKSPKVRKVKKKTKKASLKKKENPNSVAKKVDAVP